MSSLSRPDRVAKQLREEISQIMLRDMKDPRVRMASVSAVNVSPDLRNARVRISSLADDEERQLVLAAMRHAEGFVRHLLRDRLDNLRTIPRLVFELDESIAYSVRISSMLKEMQETP